MRFSDRQRHVIQGWEREGKFRLRFAALPRPRQESELALAFPSLDNVPLAV